MVPEEYGWGTVVSSVSACVYKSKICVPLPVRSRGAEDEAFGPISERRHNCLMTGVRPLTQRGETKKIREISPDPASRCLGGGEERKAKDKGMELQICDM